MLAFLAHLGLESIFYGVILALGIISPVVKIRCGMWLAAIIEVSVFVLVFKMHGGTMTGGFAAVIAGLICGNAIPFLIRR
jgi:hypothetical protein